MVRVLQYHFLDLHQSYLGGVLVFLELHRDILDVSLQVGAAKVEVAVFKTELFVGFAVVDYLEGGSFAFAENFDGADHDFDIAGGDFGIFAGTLADDAVGGDDVFASRGEGFIEDGFVGGLVKGELDDAASVAQVYEYERAEVTLFFDPAHNADLFSDIAFA